MKKLFSMILVLTFVLSTATVAFAVENPLKATKTSSTVLVDGEEVQFDAYNINNNNYFKLRDIAKILNESTKQFDVTWDGTKNAINLITGKAYTVISGELAVSINTDIKVSKANSTVYVNGNQVVMESYKINGNNFFKLRDLGKFVKFNVGWDGAKNRVLIDTEGKIEEPIVSTGKQPYTFSKTKLDYKYNFQIEGKGYINFGKDKPFMENGAMYLPVEHISYLVGKEFKWDASTGTITIGKYYTEETAPKTNTDYIFTYDKGKPVYFAYDQYGNPIVNDVRYEASFEIMFKNGSSTAEYKEVKKPTKWAMEFANNGGKYIEYDGTEIGLTNDIVFNSEVDHGYKVVVKEGKPYLAKKALTDALALSMLTDAKNGTFYYGTQEYLDKMLQEVVNPSLEMEDTFNNGKTYEETIEDVFEDPVSAW